VTCHRFQSADASAHSKGERVAGKLRPVDFNPCRGCAGIHARRARIALPLVAAVTAMATIYFFIAPPIIGYILAGFSGYLAIIQLLRICQWWKGVPKDKLLLKFADENDKTSN